MKRIFVILLASLTAGALGAEPGVKRQQPVLVRLALGAVVVETTAIATRDGRPGEVIRVRNRQTNKTYAARVAGPGVVEAIGR